MSKPVPPRLPVRKPQPVWQPVAPEKSLTVTQTLLAEENSNTNVLVAIPTDNPKLHSGADVNTSSSPAVMMPSDSPITNVLSGSKEHNAPSNIPSKPSKQPFQNVGNKQTHTHTQTTHVTIPWSFSCGVTSR